MKAWGLKLESGSLYPIAVRTRQPLMDWACQRFIGCDDYRNLPLGKAWALAKRRHPGMAIVRVTVSEDK